MDCAANMIDFMPDEQTLLMVVQGTELGRPAPSAACRAGDWPRLAERTFPISTSFTSSAVTFAAANAPAMALDPRAVADKPASEPPKLPIGVLTAETIKTSFISCP